MCVPGPQAPKGGEGYRVCALRLQGLCKWRLMGISPSYHEIDAWTAIVVFKLSYQHGLPGNLCRR